MPYRCGSRRPRASERAIQPDLRAILKAAAGYLQFSKKGSILVSVHPLTNNAGPMPATRRLPAIFVLVLTSGVLSGCGSISSFMAGGMADLLPSWAGGLPADAPPRPGTPEYEAYLKRGNPQGEALRGQDPATSPSASAVH